MLIEDHKKNDLGIERDPQVLSFFWSIAFCACFYLGLPLTGGSLNPAICLGIKLTMLFDVYNLYGFDYFYVYLICPFVGVLLALIFYRFVHLKTKDSA